MDLDHVCFLQLGKFKNAKFPASQSTRNQLVNP